MRPYSMAVISHCGLYRYELTRRWGDDPLLEWIMLNPSTADGHEDDPTIRRCIGYAEAWEFGGIVVRNLYGLRATNPKKLALVDDPMGPMNRAYLGNNIAHLTIAAWGAHPMATSWFASGNRLKRPKLQCLGTNANGSPKHPLYVRASCTPIPYEVPDAA